MIDFDEEELENAIEITPDTPAVLPTEREEKVDIVKSEDRDVNPFDCGCNPSIDPKGKLDKGFKPSPLKGELPLLFQPGTLIIIKGLVKPRAIRLKSFQITFLKSMSLDIQPAWYKRRHFHAHCGTADTIAESFVLAPCLDHTPQQAIYEFLADDCPNLLICVCLSAIVEQCLWLRMFVSFTCGTSAKSDLAFHLHPHFEEYVVLRNYRIDNRWGIEETASSRRFPYKRNEDFQMQIFLSYDNFLVAFEGEHYCGFTYRIPLKRIRFVQVYGDVDMVQIDHQQTDRYPILYDGMKLHKFVIYTKRGLSYYNKALLMAPVTAQLGEGLYEGSEIEITGKVKLLPFTFHINLQAGTQIWPHPLVALHINPRFLAEEKSQVIQNAYIKGKWGQEEKTTISRFRPGTSFSMKIGCQRGRYAMSLDGKPSCFFIQRCPPELVNTVYIHGDVWIKEIQYTRNINFVKKPNVVYGR